MRIGIVKPDYQIVGGAERVLQRVEVALRTAGHRVTTLPVRVAAASLSPYGVRVPAEVRAKTGTFFRYMSLVEEFSALDLRAFDMVVSTQPPSVAAQHSRHLSLFFHHERIYYDLSDVFCAAGYAEPGLHAAAAERVKQVDTLKMHGVRRFLAISEEVQHRLQLYNGLRDNVGLSIPGVTPPAAASERAAETPEGHVLCVSRHEFPKRTELFVQAMKLRSELRGVLVGGGGRLPFVRRVDAWLSADPAAAGEVDGRSLWLNRGELNAVPTPSFAGVSNVDIRGHVDDDALDALFRGALCIVAPAYLEDFGLTAIEGMAYGKPVVVCSDGGHLATLVEDGVTGLVVAPTARAISGAVATLRDDPELARRLGCQARSRAAEFTWARFERQLWDGIEAVMS